MKKQCIRLSRQVHISIPVRWLATLFVASAIVCAPHAARAQVTGGTVIIAGRGSSWLTPSLYIQNRSTSTVTQPLGHETFVSPGLDPIVIVPSVTLAPGEQVRILRPDFDFDPDWRQYTYDVPHGSVAGIFTQVIDPHLEARTCLEYPGVTKMCLPAFTKTFVHPGDSVKFNSVATNFAFVSGGVSYDAQGAYILMVNTTSELTTFTARVFDGKASTFTDETFTAAPGVSLYGIHREIKFGGSVQLFLGFPGGFVPGTLASPIYAALLIGSPDGTQQDVRAAE
jgi:hypothetical protein